MDWNVIPEIFYDMIARVIPGSALVLTAMMIYLGPSKAVEMLLSDSTEIDAPLTLFFLLLAYLTAVVTGPVWKALGRKDISLEEKRTLFCVRKDLPREASKLVKIQAERDLCEVLIVGFSVLWPVNLCLCVFGSSPYRGERAFLLGAMTLSIFSCWAWWTDLKDQYSIDLDVLQDILDEQEEREAEAAAQAKKWWQFWK